MDKKQNSNVGTILANMEKSFFVSKAYWIPAFAGMTNTGVLQLAHYYKIILFSSFFWGIASFASPSFAMESDDVDVHFTSPAQEIPTEDLRMKKIRILQKAISDCDQFIAFEKDFLDSCRSQNQFDISFEGISHNIEAIKRVKYFLINYEKKGKDEESLLSSFLDLRFQLLISKRKIILDSRSQDEQHQKGLLPLNAQRIIYGPTKPELFHELSPVHQLFARTSTDRYQFFNQMILHVWQLVDPRTLHPKTKLKIRASTTLWDNLTGKRDYLGHPDEAIGNYRGEEFPYKKDCVNYDDHIEEHEVKDIPLLGWGKGKFTSAYETCYSRSLWDESFLEYKKIKELPYPEWLTPLPKKNDVEITQKPITTPPVQKAPKMPRFKSPIQVIEVPTVAEEKQESIVDSPAPPILEISRPISPVPVKVDAPVALKEEPEDIRVAPVVDANENAKVTTTPLLEPLRPRGMRLFHNESASPQQNTKVFPLKGNHQLVHQKIFDPQQFKKVTYGEFKALWKHICGPQSVVESTGSSHKKLIAPNKEVFGTFAHSDSMTYSHRTIGYIRDALTQIGYGN